MKFAGFALLATGFAFAIHVYSPSRFHELQALVPEAAYETPEAESPRLAVTRNFALATADPVITTATEQPSAPLVVAALPVLPVASVATSAGNADETRNRATLVRRIQRELRRVGCYDGRIDGEWDRALRSSMGQFIERVNATLPHQEPDVVLLTLVRNHKSAACGSGCPVGQALDGTGRCLPGAIVAKDLKKPGNPASTHADASSWTTTVTVAELRPSAATLPPSTSTKAIAGSAQRTASHRAPPLAGRMAMGGPATATATTVPSAAKGWWESFITPSSDVEPERQLTLDQPVGLTRVPEPRLVRREAVLPSRQIMQRQASVSGVDGASDGAALGPTTVQTTTLAPPRARSARTYRKSSRAKSKSRYASRGRGRSVQALFQHPLGRM